MKKLKLLIGITVLISLQVLAVEKNTVKQMKELEEKKQIIKEFLKEEEKKREVSKEVSLKDRDGKIVEEIKVNINPVLLEKDLKKSLDKGKVETEMVKPPPVPIIIPPKVVRVLIYPYIDSKGNFHGPNYVFTEVKKSRWVVGDYLPSADMYFSSKRFTVLER